MLAVTAILLMETIFVLLKDMSTVLTDGRLTDVRRKEESQNESITMTRAHEIRMGY